MTTIKDVFEYLLNNRRITAAEAFNRHFGTPFRQRTNWTWDDRPAVVAKVAELRDVVDRATITGLYEFIEGDRYAERHVINIVKRDGDRTSQEVYVFAERDSNA